MTDTSLQCCPAMKHLNPLLAVCTQAAYTDEIAQIEDAAPAAPTPVSA